MFKNVWIFFLELIVLLAVGKACKLLSNVSRMKAQRPILQVILRDFHVIVYPRPGYPLPEEGVKYLTVQWVDAPLFNISSTEIRQRLKLGQSLSDWVDIKVEKFLHHVIAKD